MEGFAKQNDYKINQEDDFDDNLNQSLLSQAAQSEVSADITSTKLNEESQKRNQDYLKKIEEEGYNDYQIPPSIEIAKRYWDCSGIGTKSPEEDSPGVEGLPGFLRTPLKRFPYKTDPVKIRGFGSTIPLFYLFIRCCLVLLPIQYFGTFYLGILFRNLYCRGQKLKGKECSFFDLETYKVTDTRPLIHDTNEQDDAQIAIGLLIFLPCIYLMYLVIFWFSWKKVKLRFACKDEVEEGVISEFTIMVERVNGNNPKGLGPVHEFISELMEEEGLPEPKVEKALLAKATGKIERVRNELEYSRGELGAIEYHKSLVDGVDDHKSHALRSKNFEKMIKSEKKNIKTILKKIKKIEKRKVVDSSKNINSIAFISFETNLDRDRVLMAYNKKYRGFFSWCSASPRYKISPAKQPESIIWDNIGHSRTSAILRACLTRPLLILLTPIFIIAFFIFNTVFYCLHLYFKNKMLIPLLNISLFLIIKIFSFATLKTIDFLNGFEVGVTKNE